MIKSRYFFLFWEGIVVIGIDTYQNLFIEQNKNYF